MFFLHFTLYSVYNRIVRESLVLRHYASPPDSGGITRRAALCLYTRAKILNIFSSGNRTACPLTFTRLWPCHNWAFIAYVIQKYNLFIYFNNITKTVSCYTQAYLLLRNSFLLLCMLEGGSFQILSFLMRIEPTTIAYTFKCCSTAPRRPQQKKQL